MRQLHVFDTAEEAHSFCEGVDVGIGLGEDANVRSPERVEDGYRDRWMVESWDRGDGSTLLVLHEHPEYSVASRVKNILLADTTWTVETALGIAEVLRMHGFSIPHHYGDGTLHA